VLNVYLGNVRRIRGDHAGALASLDEAAAWFGARGNRLWRARALNGTARSLQNATDLDGALAMAREALDTLPPEAYDERAASYRVIGGVAMERREWETARRAFSESLALWRAGGDPRYIAFGHANLGSALRALQRYDEAEAAIREAIATFARAGDGFNEGIAHNMLGNLFLHRGPYEAAIEHYHRAEQLLRRSNDQVHMAGIYNNWGMAFAKLGQWERAKRAAEQSIRFWQRAENQVQQANAMDNLGVAQAELGDRAAALATWRAALDLLGDELPGLREEIVEHMESVNSA
jgi:tetratricopeptide (TPR) repeat protein